MEQIRQGYPTSPSHSPIGFAVVDALQPLRFEVACWPTELHLFFLGPPFETFTMPLAGEVTGWIVDFDMGRPVTPFAFDVTLPPRIQAALDVARGHSGESHAT